MVILERREAIRKRHRIRKRRFYIVLTVFIILFGALLYYFLRAPEPVAAPDSARNLVIVPTPTPYLERGTGGGTELTLSLTDPDTKNNRDLALFAEEAWSRQWGYVWGTFGDILTGELLSFKREQYPEDVGDYEDFIRTTWLGRRTADCVGLIKAYAWYDPYSGSIGYCAGELPDWSTESLFEAAAESGPVDTIPEIPGLIVYREGHVGIYMGDGIVIESKGTELGVVKTKLSESEFTHWFKCPCIEYDE